MLEGYTNRVPPVKTRQQIAADATLQAIVEAAARLFGEHGYHATSIATIATEAGVAVQTIYNSVGSKRDLLSRALDRAAASDRAPGPVAQFMRAQAAGEPDPERIIAQLVEFWRGALPRTAPVFRIIREAAAGDPEVAELERARAEQRLRNYRDAAEIIAARTPLRGGLSADDAAAAIFAIGHPDTYRSLVLDGAWDDERWAAWAQDALKAVLLGP